MKLNVLSTFKTYLTTRICKTLARCWRVETFGGDVYGYTSGTRDIVFNGVTYRAMFGLSSSAIKSTEDLSDDSLVVSAFLQSQDELDIISGVYDNAKVVRFIVNYYDLLMGEIIERVGYLGEITVSDGVFSAEIRGLTHILGTKIGEFFSASCQARLGDSRCRAVILPVQIMASCTVEGIAQTITRVSSASSWIIDGFLVGATIIITGSNEDNNVTRVIAELTPLVMTLDGAPLTDEASVLLTVFQISTFHVTGTVATIVSQKEITVTITGDFDDGWFTEGNLKFTDGLNINIKRDIRFHIGSTLKFFLEYPRVIEIGDGFELIVGCTKDKDTCINKFNNLINFRGFPYTPTNENTFDSPISGASPEETVV